MERKINQVSLTSPVFGPELVQFSFLILLVLQQLGEIFGRMFITRCGGENDVAVDGRSSWRWMALLSFLSTIQLDHVVYQLELVINGPSNSVMRTFAAGCFQIFNLIQFAYGLCHRCVWTLMRCFLSGCRFFRFAIVEHRRWSGTGWWTRRQDTSSGSGGRRRCGY